MFIIAVKFGKKLNAISMKLILGNILNQNKNDILFVITVYVFAITVIVITEL